MTTADPVGATEIAARAGVGRPTVERWQQRHPDFPKPRWTVGGRPAWNWPDIADWLHGTDRIIYVEVSPQRFANRTFILGAPESRREQLIALADRLCPATGHYAEVSGKYVSELLFAQPHRAYGHDPDDEYQPDDAELDWHHSHGEDPGTCRVCRPPVMPWKERLLERTAAAVAALAGENGDS